MHPEPPAIRSPLASAGGTAPAGAGAREALKIALFCLLVAQCAFLAYAAFTGAWVVDGRGDPIARDFINVWAAGRLTLEGHAAEAYDWVRHRTMETRGLGGDFSGYFGWHYPPYFLLVAAPLSALPYVPAMAAWMALTLPAYLLAVRAILPGSLALVAALAWPPVTWNVAVGQNGFLTAGLFGGALAILPTRPLVGGLLIGLLTYKPHFGLLVPIALIAGGYWRPALTAAATFAALALISILALGIDPWHAFAGSLHQVSDAVLVAGHGDFSKLQTVFGMMRLTGMEEGAAWLAQALVSTLCATAVAVLWRSEASYDLKAAALAVAALLASPYAYIYDIVLLAIPVAFLARQGIGWGEGVALAAVLGCVLAYPVTGGPTGFGACLIVAALIAVRAARGQRAISIPGPPIGAG